MMELRHGAFDVETVYAKVITEKKKPPKVQRGTNSPVYRSLFPMIYVIRIFGLGPYDFIDDQLVPANTYLIMTLIFTTMYSYIIYIVGRGFTGAHQDRPILGGIEILKVTFNYFVAMHDLLTTVLTREKFVTIWNKFQDYDEAVRQLGYKRSETITMVNAWIIVVINIVVWTAVNQGGMYAFNEVWIYNISYMIVYVGTCTGLHKFVGMALLLGQRFRHLNELLKKNIPRSSSLKLSMNIDIKTIESLYNELMIAGENLNSLFTCSLLVWIANLTLHSVCNTYFIIVWALLTPWEQVAWPPVFCLSFWLAAFIYQIIILHIACDYPTREAKTFSCIMIEWQIQMKKRYKDYHVRNFLHLLYRKLNFTAAGCFNVNFSLLCSIGALLTTYLVILLQFPE